MSCSSGVVYKHVSFLVFSGCDVNCLGYVYLCLKLVKNQNKIVLCLINLHVRVDEAAKRCSMYM